MRQGQLAGAIVEPKPPTSDDHSGASCTIAAPTTSTHATSPNQFKNHLKSGKSHSSSRSGLNSRTRKYMMPIACWAAFFLTRSRPRLSSCSVSGEASALSRLEL